MNDSSDHFPIFSVYKQYFKNINYCNKVLFYLMNEFCMSNLYDDFSKLDFNYIYSLDCEAAVVELHEKLFRFSNKHYKFISKKDKLKPWINQYLKM